MNIKTGILLLAIHLLFTQTAIGQRDTSDVNKKFVLPKQTATFPGGIDKFYRYIEKNLVYPKDEKKQKISGEVFVEFVIDESGAVDKESIRVIPAEELKRTMPPSSNGTKRQIHDLPEIFNEEARRVIQESPKWIPAKDNGQFVRTKFVVPVTF